MPTTPVTRRCALKSLLAGGIALATPAAWASVPATQVAPDLLSGVLSCRNAHTGDFADVSYLTSYGDYCTEGLHELDHLFRCHYTGEACRIDRRLYMVLDALRTDLGVGQQPYELYSGYRSPEYNRLLRTKSRKVAKNSFHLRGMAADVSLEGVSLKQLQQAANRLQLGGVGRYDQFVHVDVGPVRSW